MSDTAFLSPDQDEALTELVRRGVDPAVATVTVVNAQQAGYASLPDVGVTFDEDGYLIDADGSDEDPPGHRDVVLAFTREQVTEWAGRELSDDDLIRLRAALPFSSCPEAIGTIADSLREPGSGDDEDDEELEP